MSEPLSDHFDWTARLRQLVELRDAIRRAPLKFRRELKAGPREEPSCGVCSAVAAINGCGGYSDPITEYHEVGVIDYAELLGETEDWANVAAMITDEAEPLIRALSGALAAERCLTIYLLAGWRPPTGLRPEFIGAEERHAA